MTSPDGITFSDCEWRATIRAHYFNTGADMDFTDSVEMIIVSALTDWIIRMTTSEPFQEKAPTDFGSGAESGSEKRGDSESDCDPDSDSDPDNTVQAAVNGSYAKAAGIAGGCLLN